MKLFKVLLLGLCLFTAPAFAALPPLSEVEFVLDNSGPGASVRLGTQLADKTLHALRAQYSFAASGGAKSAISLLDVDGKPAIVPANAIVTDCMIDVVTAPTATAAAAVSFGLASAADLKVLQVATSTYASGRVACIPVGSAATSIKVTSDTTATMTIATFPLTAGKLNLWLWYVVSQ
jgi:hypothetical protein